MRIAALVEQVTTADETGLEMSPGCRRVVSQAVDLADQSDGSCTFIALGPASTVDTLREALAWALERDVHADGVRVVDPDASSSDARVSTHAVAVAIERLGPFDLVVVGHTSTAVDAIDLGPELATLLGLPFRADEGWAADDPLLPTVLAPSERLEIDPCTVDPPGRAAVPAHLLRTLPAVDLA